MIGGGAAQVLVHPRLHSRNVVADRLANLPEGRRVAGQPAFVPGAGADAGDGSQPFHVNVLVGAHWKSSVQNRFGNAPNQRGHSMAPEKLAV